MRAVLIGDLKQKRVAKHSKTFLALVLGTVAGLVANRYWAHTPLLSKVVRYAVEPVGNIWLRSLLMIAVPLVFSSLTLGTSGIGNFRRLGKIGVKLFAFILATQMLAATLGSLAADRFRPGDGISTALRERLLSAYRQEPGASDHQTSPLGFASEAWSNIVPANPIAAAASDNMLGIVIFSLLFGIGAALLPSSRTGAFMGALAGLNDILMALVDLAIRAAPAGVFALVFSAAAQFGMDLVIHLGLYVATCLGGLLVLELGIYPIIVASLTSFRPALFLVQIREALLTAFSTGSSNATLPTAIRVSETTLRLPAAVCRFVLPICATMCKNGTALFDAVPFGALGDLCVGWMVRRDVDRIFDFREKQISLLFPAEHIA
jgi:DAACS family dicarboxylate/amino acid:cation (Na+ or H+) symporter